MDKCKICPGHIDWRIKSIIDVIGICTRCYQPHEKFFDRNQFVVQTISEEFYEDTVQLATENTVRMARERLQGIKKPDFVLMTRWIDASKASTES